MLYKLYDIALNIAYNINRLWEYLQKNITISFDLGFFEFNKTFDFSVLDLLGTSIILWLGFLILKNLIPFT